MQWIFQKCTSWWYDHHMSGNVYCVARSRLHLRSCTGWWRLLVTGPPRNAWKSVSDYTCQGWLQWWLSCCLMTLLSMPLPWSCKVRSPQVCAPPPFAKFTQLEVESCIPDSSKFYCPNPGCSMLLIVDEQHSAHKQQQQQASRCPVCQEAVCVACKVLWHDNMVSV